MRSPRAGERGQALPLLVVVLLAAVAATLVVAQLGVAALHRARARTAADAAALAGAAEGEAAARALATANGAELVTFAVLGSTVEVAVRHGPASATATAERATAAPHRGVVPALAAALARAEQLLGRRIEVLAVLDGGTAIEVDAATAALIVALAEHAGLCRQAPQTRPVHFEPCPPIPPG